MRFFRDNKEEAMENIHEAISLYTRQAQERNMQSTMKKVLISLFVIIGIAVLIWAILPVYTGPAPTEPPLSEIKKLTRLDFPKSSNLIHSYSNRSRDGWTFAEVEVNKADIDVLFKSLPSPVVESTTDTFVNDLAWPAHMPEWWPSGKPTKFRASYHKSESGEWLYLFADLDSLSRSKIFIYRGFP